MDGSDGAKFASLQRAAEVEKESVFETLLVATLHGCASVYEESVPCVCVGELWGLLFGCGGR